MDVMIDQSARDEFFHEDLKYKKFKGDLAFASTVVETGMGRLKMKYLRALAYSKSNAFLYQKFSSSQNYYYIKDINEVI